jgi:4'-phosphopantetheinyl transferase
MIALPPGEVHVWLVDLAPPEAEVARQERMLAAPERERAARFLFPADRRRFIVAHAALREVGAAYLATPAESLAFAPGSRGKPALAAPSERWLCFNLSHSHEAAMIACARDREVGADLEAVRENVDCADIVARFFSPDERREWAALPAAVRREAFFRGWTCKEAYVKALGEGLSHPPEAYSVRLDPGKPAGLIEDRLRPGAERGWTLRAVAAPPGYFAAVAFAGEDALVTSRSWPLPPTASRISARSGVSARIDRSPA